MFKMISLGLFVAACFAPGSSAAKDNYICAPVGLTCDADSFLEEDLWPARYDLDHKGIYLLHFCKKEKDRQSTTPIQNGKAQGFTRDCKKVFEARFEKSIQEATYFWPNGKPRELITYNDAGSANRVFFDETNAQVRFSDVPFEHVEKKPTAVINIQPTKQDRESGATQRLGAVRVCLDQPVADFDLESLEDKFRKQHLLFSYKGIFDRSAILVSTPEYTQARDQASFYYFSILLNACDAQNTCSATISAFRKTAPVSDGVIQLAQATNSDDELTNSLVSIAAKSIRDPIRWCYFASATFPDLDRLFPFPRIFR